MRSLILCALLASGVAGCTYISPKAPGIEVTEVTQRGGGACSDRTLVALIESIHQMAPELSQISVLRSDNVHDAAGDIVAFQRYDGGFDLAFEYGEDCVGDCLSYQYWYWSTDRFCLPIEIGTYLRVWLGSCWDSVGVPMWGVPGGLPWGDFCSR